MSANATGTRVRTKKTTDPFTRLESEVRSYCRSFPVRWRAARNATLISDDGTEYIDFLAGCSSLNYGHNDPDMKAALIAYLNEDGIAHGLDMHTEAKAAFLQAFGDIVLKPRNMDYRLQFTGPTGANAVEAALKLARRVTGRTNVIAFTNGFHGVSTAALAVTANRYHRAASGAALNYVTRMPYDGYFGEDTDTAEQIRHILRDPSGGVDPPAAFILETVQGEGGLKTASAAWMRSIQALAKESGALMIVDDIQAGCGRTGTFFSFEKMGVEPDMILLAKSLSGMGLPLSMVLIKPEHDRWRPGEHNGSFRGNNHAFVTARVALQKFWSDSGAGLDLERKSQNLQSALENIGSRHGLTLRGRGMFQGIDLKTSEIAAAVSQKCFEQRLIIELSGAHDEILKVLAPLTTPGEQMERGLKIIAESVDEIFGKALYTASSNTD